MKGLRRLWNLVGSVLVGLIVLLAIALAGVRALGLTPYAVLSGSMEPTYPVGSLIYVKKVDPSEVQVGDAITFVVNDDLLVATHRVVDVEVRTTRCQAVLDENGAAVTDAAGNPLFEEIPLDEPAYYYTTKGDANNAADGAQVYDKNLLGKPVFAIPYLGYLSSWIQTGRGRTISFCIAVALLALTFLPTNRRTGRHSATRD